MALYNNIRGGERDPPIPLLLWVALYRVPLRHTDPSIHPSLHPSLFSRIILQDPPTGSWQRCRGVPLDSAAAATPMRGYRNRFPPKRTGRRPESTRLSFHHIGKCRVAPGTTRRLLQKYNPNIFGAFSTFTPFFGDFSGFHWFLWNFIIF